VYKDKGWGSLGDWLGNGHIAMIYWKLRRSCLPCSKNIRQKQTIRKMYLLRIWVSNH
jgi:hypothetical protein